MPSRRMIDPAFWESATIAGFDFFQRLLFVGLFSQADDQGRLKAHPALLRSRIFPYDDIPLQDITDALDVFEQAESITVYSVDGTTYLQILNWWKYQKPQWAWPSEIPAPDGWEDQLAYRRGNETVYQNWPGRDDKLDDPSGDDDADLMDEPAQDDATVAPEWGHSGASAGPAPRTSISSSTSSRGRTSTSTSNSTGTDADNGYADVGAGKRLLSAFGVDEPSLSACAGYPLAFIEGYIEAARQKKSLTNPQGWVVRGLQSGKPPPRARDPTADRRRFVANEAVMR